MDGPIPNCVLDALESVRNGGKTNMLDRSAVINLLPVEYDPLDSSDFLVAAEWLSANPDRYMEALVAMGERVKNG